jgi:anti-anti-sigma factor
MLSDPKAAMGNNDIFPGFDEEANDFLTIQLQKVEDVDSCLALKLKGQIDTYSSPFFQRSVNKVTAAGFVRLILVLSGVDYVSSKAVGAFVQMKKAANDKGGEIAIVDIPPKVMEVFKNLSLDRFLYCVDSLDEAIELMTRGMKALPFSELFECPNCKRKLRALKVGRFRCPECMAALSITEAGVVRLRDT